MTLSAVNVAIPDIAVGLSANAMQLNWIPTAFLLTSAALLLPVGRLADMHGRKRLFLVGLTIMAVASAAASAAPSIRFLIACRVLQGVGASMLFGTGVAILTSVFPPNRRGFALGFSVSSVYLGLTCGPLLGGWVTHYFSWRAVFMVHVPFALLNLGIAGLFLRGEWRDPQHRQFDLPGAVVYSASIFLFMYGFSHLPGSVGLACIVLGALGLAVFVRRQRRIESPLFDVRLFFGNRVFTFSCLAALVVYSSTFATSYLMSLYLQYLKGLSAEAAGFILISQPLVMALGSPLFGRLSDRYEPRYVASAGLVLMASGLGLLAALGKDSSIAYVIAALSVVGLGFAMFSSPNVNAIMGSVDRRFLGAAAASVSTARVLGQMFSMGIVTVVFALLMGRVQIVPERFGDLLASITGSFTVGATLCFCAIFLSLARGDLHARA